MNNSLAIFFPDFVLPSDPICLNRTACVIYGNFLQLEQSSDPPGKFSPSLVQLGFFLGDLASTCSVVIWETAKTYFSPSVPRLGFHESYHQSPSSHNREAEIVTDDLSRTDRNRGNDVVSIDHVRRCSGPMATCFRRSSRLCFWRAAPRPSSWPWPCPSGSRPSLSPSISSGEAAAAAAGEGGGGGPAPGGRGDPRAAPPASGGDRRRRRRGAASEQGRPAGHGQRQRRNQRPVREIMVDGTSCQPRQAGLRGRGPPPGALPRRRRRRRRRR